MHFSLSTTVIAAISLFVAVHALSAEKVARDGLKQSVTFYASFDDGVRADFGKGVRAVSTRQDVDPKRNQYARKPGYDRKVFHIVRGKGVSGGALSVTDVLPRRGRIYFPAKGNLAFRKGGWSGAASVWINTNPDKQLKTRYCDPLQITQKGATNGGIWFDFTPDKPRSLRMGTFPARKPGKKAVPTSGPKAPVVRVKAVGFRKGDWHHIVLSWRNFDTDRNNAQASLYIDGKRIGTIKGREIAMNWDPDKTGIYVAVNYIGLLDELSLFNRALTADEIRQLHKRPGLLADLKTGRK